MKTQSANKNKLTLQLAKAINAFKKAIGENNVLSNDNDYSTTTFRVERKVLGVVLPNNKEDVIACVQIAIEYQLPIYPVSAGKNFGLGSKIPTSDHSLVMDLKRMNKISEYNEELCHVTLQPGVTFKQLENFLTEEGDKLMMDSIGSTPQASIIGNTMERGHGMGLYADRFDHVCDLEVVLSTGQIIRTNYGHHQSNKVSKLTKWGLGPSLTGLFTQSNFGIVTELTMWLKPRPKHFQSFMLHINNDDDFSKVVNQFRDMRLNGLQTSFRVFNDYRMFAFYNQYHQVKNESENHISRKRLNELKPKTMGKWIAIGGLYSFSQKNAEAERDYIISSLINLDISISFWDKKTADKICSESPDRQDEMDFFFYKSSLVGFTSSMALNMCYWRVPKPIPEDKNIHNDQCGLLWYCPSIPCTGKDALIVNHIIEEISFKYHLEPNLGYLFISNRTLDITGAICFDKSNTEEMKNAQKCHDEIMEKLIDAGYPPYRLGIQSMGLFEKIGGETLSVLDKLKNSLDPNKIFSSNRYSRL